ncbi:hemin-degrading factor [Ottowia thiooxydans]|uniref:hemin-degrading factor n=1 Tax=Ottowia thiooxydans TaxID=219182 RepID=UPI00048D9178|nr:hemin-degrading factor [Ottowia thiooxydans]
MNVDILRTRFAQARAAGKRARDAAESIGVSEGEAVAAHAGNHEGPLKAVPLGKSWLEILKALGECGPVLALTRNETTVHEKTGVYENVSAAGPVVGLALGGPIDLRLFFMHWHAGFAVTEAAAQPNVPASLSLQFYDASGLAVHKVFCREATNRAAFEALMQRFADASLSPEFKPKAPAPAIQDDEAIDADGLLEAWGGMKDTHDFYEILKKFGVERQQSFRLADGRFARRASPSVARQLLQEAAFDGAPIMVFVGSLGCIQIHSGPVTRIEPMEIRGVQWLNVLDPDFNLHMQEDSIANAWVVEKPTSDGIVTSVELFDAKGELMAMFFGERKPGNPEREDWRAIVRKAAPTSAVAA